MSRETVTVLNAYTGGTAVIRKDWLSNPRIIDPEVFSVVETGTKPYASATYKPRSAQDFEEQHPEKTIAPVIDDEPEFDVDTEQEDED